MILALAGNQNSGKTTLFNLLTGSSQRVGNWPGVTVEKKEGGIRKHPEYTLVDLPGIYSLSPYSIEEVVARDFLTGGEPEGIINIVDATNIERNLYLTLQLCELQKPMVIALNMMDEAQARGDIFRIDALSRELGIPVVPISARNGEGAEALIRTVIRTMQTKEPPPIRDICHGPLHESLHAIAHLIEHKSDEQGFPHRYAATKLTEGDCPMQERLGLDEHEIHIINEICELMEHRLGQERDAALADARYNFIEELIARNIIRARNDGEMTLSQKIDRVLTGRWTALLCFFGILSLVFWLTFGPVGSFLQNSFAGILDMASSAVDKWLQSMEIAEWLRGLIVDGALAGIFSMLGFLPLILLLFFFLSLLEDSGYMARAAFVTDRILRRFGLSGRAFFPMIMGFGCSVPAIMAARGVTSVKERHLTVLITPFMSCAARIPIYGLFTAAFFPESGFWIMMALYLFGVAVALLCAFVLKDAPAFKATDTPFVMELPPYRLPTVRTVARLLWDKGSDFVRRAFTVIFAATVIIWFLQSFSPSLRMVENNGESLLAVIGGVLAPLFAPLGFGTWQASTALLTGFAAKEAVVSTMAVLYSTGVEDLPAMLSSVAGFTPASAVSFMVFTLLYMPCVAAFAAMKRELGGLGRAILAAAFQTGVAWLMSYLVFQFIHLIEG